MTEVERLDTYNLVFPKLGIDITVKSVAFTLFGLEITWYGILITFGMILAIIYAFRNMKRYGIDADRAYDVIIVGILGGIIGARLYYVITNWKDYAGDWKAIINIRGGGLAIYGGIIGALLMGALTCKIRKVRMLPMLDLAAIGLLIGQGIGRWGNFTNHEAFGTNTNSIFGMSSGKIQTWILSHTTSLDTLYAKGIEVSEKYPVHPCFLYESFWCLLGVVILGTYAKKHRKYDGQIFLMYVAWYGFERFWVESLRLDSLYVGQLRISRVVAAVSFTIAVILLFVCGNKVKRMGSDYKFYYQTEESRLLMEETALKYEKKSKKAKEEEPVESIIMEETESNQTVDTPENSDAQTDEEYSEKMESEEK